MARRAVIGIASGAARTVGAILLAVSILAMPQMQIVTGRFAAIFQVLCCVALASVAIAWLVGVRVFLRFFDQYLSRN